MPAPIKFRPGLPVEDDEHAYHKGLLATFVCSTPSRPLMTL